MASVSTTGTLGIAGASVSIDVSGLGTATIDIAGTWAGTVTFYVAGALGTRGAVDAFTADAPSTAVNSTTGNGLWTVPVSGYKTLVVVMTSYTSGTASIGMLAAESGGGSGGGGSAGVPGSSDTQESTQLSVLGAVDGLEALLGTTNTTLTAIDGRVDGLEGGIGAAADPAATQGSTGSVSAKLRTATGQLNTIQTLLTPLTRQDTYTTTANGTTVTATSYVIKQLGVQVKGTGASATSWTIEVEISLDGTNFDSIFTHTNTTDSDGSIAWFPTPTPALYFRTRCSAVVLGGASNIVATVLGAP